MHKIKGKGIYFVYVAVFVINAYLFLYPVNR